MTAVRLEPVPAAVAGAAAADPPRWHLRIDGVDGGPVTWDVLRGLARRGELKPTDAVRRTDEDRWTLASQARCPEPAARPATTPAAAPATPRPPAAAAAGRPGGAALPALALSLAGLAAYALPLGLLAVYLGGSAAAAVAGRPGGRGRLAVALAAVLVGLADVGLALWALGGRAGDLADRLAAVGR